MQITIRQREKLRLKKLVELGFFSSVEEATNEAINFLYVDFLTKELEKAGKAQAAEQVDIPQQFDQVFQENIEDILA